MPIIYSSLWFTAVGLILSLITNVDRFILGFLQSKETVGLYAGAMSIFHIGTFFSSSVKNSMLPVLSEYFAKTTTFKNPVFIRYINKIMSYSIIVAGFFMFFVLGFRNELIFLFFGEQYRDAAVYVVLLVFALIFFSTYLFAPTLMISLDRLKSATLMCLLSFILSGVCMYFLTRLIGALGTAYGFIFSFLLLNIGYYGFILRDLPFHWTRQGILIFLTLGIAYILTTIFGSLLLRIIFVGSFSLLYLFFLWIGKYLEKRELEIIFKRFYFR